MPGPLDAGYSFLDTAAMYGMGHNGTPIGRTLSHRRDEFVLASRCGIARGEEGNLSVDGRPETLKQTCEKSLQLLQTDVIDRYYLHRLDPWVPVKESVGALTYAGAPGRRLPDSASKGDYWSRLSYNGKRRLFFY